MITFFLGIFRMGFLDVVLSRALLRGFITAIVSRSRAGAVQRGTDSERL